jgi:hypothetical protein
VAHNKPDGKELKQVVIDTAKLQKSPFVVNPKTPAVHPAQPVFYKHKQIKTLEKITDTYIIPETLKLQIAIVENNNIQPKDTVINGKPPLGQVVAKVKMKVVHINELDLTENEPEYPSVLSTAPYTPSISIRHMKIVHINELGIEDPETNAWYRDFHNNPVRITFFNNLIRDTYANYGKLAY